jgi:hypothetical protein
MDFIKIFFLKKERKTIMVYTAYNCEQIYMKRIMVAGGGMGNGNAYAVVEILYNDEQMEEVDSVWYKEFGDNPINKRIGNEVEWCEYDTFKILEDGEYVEEEDKEEEEEEEEEDEDKVSGRISDFDFVSLYPSAMKTKIKV